MTNAQNISSHQPKSLWAASASDAPKTQPLQGSHKASVVIIGGGYTGLSTALHLGEAGKEVILLEDKEIGYGGSGRNVGLVNAGLWINPDDIEIKLGKEYGDRLNSTLGKAPDLVFSLIERFDIECEAVRKGTLHMAHSRGGQKQLDTKAEQLLKRGAPIQLLDATTTAALSGTEQYKGSLFDPRAGTIQPLSYARGLATAAMSLGAKICTSSAVTELASTPKGSWKVTTAMGEIEAENVVFATNAYSSNLFKGLKQTFTPLNYFQFATTPLDSSALEKILPERQACWDTRQVMSSFRLDNAGRLIVGSIGEVTDQGSKFLQDWASDLLSKLFPEIFPKSLVKNNKTFWQYGWSGRIAVSEDNLPHLHLLAPGILTCIGYSGRGIGPGTVMGKAMAEHIMGTPMEDLPLPFTHPSKVIGRSIRKQYYARGSDLYHIYQRII